MEVREWTDKLEADFILKEAEPLLGGGSEKGIQEFLDERGYAKDNEEGDRRIPKNIFGDTLWDTIANSFKVYAGDPFLGVRSFGTHFDYLWVRPTPLLLLLIAFDIFQLSN